mmetsp:Transcript_39192/g.112424  ORF Transcript_39192/g.112424 Transcript_39192/m.112424 type:complete len:396 (-) Transcript_39192:109-1296(-)
MLLQASRDGNLEVVLRLLYTNPFIDRQDLRDALWEAVRCRRVEVLRSLLEFKVDPCSAPSASISQPPPNLKNAPWTPIVALAVNGSKERADVVAELLATGRCREVGQTSGAKSSGAPALPRSGATGASSTASLGPSTTGGGGGGASSSTAASLKPIARHSGGYPTPPSSSPTRLPVAASSSSSLPFSATAGTTTAFARTDSTSPRQPSAPSSRPSSRQASAQSSPVVARRPSGNGGGGGPGDVRQSASFFPEEQEEEIVTTMPRSTADLLCRVVRGGDGGGGTPTAAADRLRGLGVEELGALEAELDALLRAVRSCHQQRMLEQLQSVQRRHEEVCRGREALEEEQACVVCSEKPKAMLFLPCRHLCTCDGCGGQLRQCPICRADIDDKVHAYRS